jgi:hypothetical protein
MEAESSLIKNSNTVAAKISFLRTMHVVQKQDSTLLRWATDQSKPLNILPVDM